eukprot:scaffold124336_cov63-Phaeocystis_antarctica.AAC.3
MCSGYRVHALHCRTRSTRRTAQHSAHTARTAHSINTEHSTGSTADGAYVHTMRMHLLVGAAVSTHGEHVDEQLLEQLDDRRVAEVVAALLQRHRQQLLQLCGGIRHLLRLQARRRALQTHRTRRIPLGQRCGGADLRLGARAERDERVHGGGADRAQGGDAVGEAWVDGVQGAEDRRADDAARGGGH